jgi:uncharacterized protein
MIGDEQSLRDIYGEASGLAVQKVRPALDAYSRRFIAMSPFLVISTASADGRADVSPRGDPPGFVTVIDDHTILIPDRPGNNRLDTMANIVQNPHVACLFFIPGFEDTLRLAGRASITADAALLAGAAINGRVPATGIRIAIDEIFLHCAKALKRSRLWQDDYRQDRSALPSLGRIILDQVCGTTADDKTVADADMAVEDAYRTRLY